MGQQDQVRVSELGCDWLRGGRRVGVTCRPPCWDQECVSGSAGRGDWENWEDWRGVLVELLPA